MLQPDLTLERTLQYGTELIYEFYIMLSITSDYYLHIVYWFFCDLHVYWLFFVIYTQYVSWEIWTEF